MQKRIELNNFFSIIIIIIIIIITTNWMTGWWWFYPRQTQKGFSYSLCVQTYSGAHPASCRMGTGFPIPGGKVWPGRDADPFPPSSAKFKN
jgi:hypothetical protein